MRDTLLVVLGLSEDRLRDPALAFAASLRTTDPVAMRLAVSLVVNVKQRESGTGVTELAVTLPGGFLDQDT
jgi:hypothetical protein